MFLLLYFKSFKNTFAILLLFLYANIFLFKQKTIPSQCHLLFSIFSCLFKYFQPIFYIFVHSLAHQIDYSGHGSVQKVDTSVSHFAFHWAFVTSNNSKYSTQTAAHRVRPATQPWKGPTWPPHRKHHRCRKRTQSCAPQSAARSLPTA